eukprot:CAMPEP_0174325086 /NCGR_PEP_ID=MMETSP0810-20121108/13006_1 /TAXON_ID=73025 ORGANISM="Eutreptiella gymnastica-like, Strain CCMP1594" /NCGR_SAMPLE_ID=MMETSP0810 /ASSEMBLY_ACC=CAM_ASM_000659 /LENGTH=139 /DNA_ID=CAMNT_0015438263 /DNA_START=211 /DNA_END=628 /DNA_ORIENTATION=+
MCVCVGEVFPRKHGGPTDGPSELSGRVTGRACTREVVQRRRGHSRDWGGGPLPQLQAVVLLRYRLDEFFGSTVLVDDAVRTASAVKLDVGLRAVGGPHAQQPLEAFGEQLLQEVRAQHHLLPAPLQVLVQDHHVRPGQH